MSFQVLWNEVSPYTVGHFTGGAVTILSAQISPVSTVVLFVGFIIYELNEDWHINDSAFKDILEFYLGMMVAAIALLLLFW